MSEKANNRLIAGAMSGTSADGVDVAIVEVEGRGLAMTAKPLSHAYEPFSPELRKQILDVRQRGNVRLSDLAEMGRQVTLAHVRAFATACLSARVDSSQIAAIAAHGQTFFHSPPNTIQYFDPSLLAFQTGCAVVSDFRRADLAAGGQGAPLVPFADWILFRHPTKSRVILNIGGIANLTYLKAGGTIDEVIAFDTGPGNCLSDWIAREAGLDRGIDVGGVTARNGEAHFATALMFARNTFVFAKPPKSTDGPAMIELFEDHEQRLSPSATTADRLATAAMAVAHSISMTFDVHLPNWRTLLDEVFVGGGGAQNAAIMNELESVLTQTRVSLSSLTPLSLPSPRDTGDRDQKAPRVVDLTAAREAIAFALLGAATLDGEPSNVPSATGASRRVVLGSITPKP